MTAVTAVAAAGTTLARIGAGLLGAPVPVGAPGSGSAGASAIQAVARQPLPAKPPIGGPVWTIVVPAALLLVSIWGTWMLYRHFAGEK
jgi:F0F1-type ATP synthase membrane subunit c/vacuolar-type H+-ATPase subunit K